MMEPNARRLAAYLLMHRLREFMGRDFFPFFFSFLFFSFLFFSFLFFSFFSFLSVFFFFFKNRNLISSFSGFTIDATKLEAAMSTCEILGLDQRKVTLQKRLDDKVSKKKLVFLHLVHLHLHLLLLLFLFLKPKNCKDPLIVTLEGFLEMDTRRFNRCMFLPSIPSLSLSLFLFCSYIFPMFLQQTYVLTSEF